MPLQRDVLNEAEFLVNDHKAGTLKVALVLKGNTTKEKQAHFTKQ